MSFIRKEVPALYPEFKGRYHPLLGKRYGYAYTVWKDGKETTLFYLKPFHHLVRLRLRMKTWLAYHSSFYRRYVVWRIRGNSRSRK